MVGWDELLADLQTFPDRAHKQLRDVVKRGAQNIKDDWRARWEAIQHHPTHIPHLPRGVGYDLDSGPDWHRAEIGVHPHNRQANLAHIISFGTVNGNAPHDAGQDALDAEEPRFVRAVLDAAVELLDGRRR